MLVVLSDFVQTVMPQGDLKPQQIRASPAGFGARAEQARSQGGDMLARHVIRRQQLLNAKISRLPDEHATANGKQKDKTSSWRLG